MPTATLSNMAQVPGAVAAVLGFTPTDSLVVLGLGGGPTARVDAGEDLTAPLVALQAAARHWRACPPLVVLFGTTHTLSTLVDYWAQCMGGVEVRDFLQVDYGCVTSWQQGRTVPVDPAGLDPVLAAVRVVASREDIEAEAAEVTDAEAAWTMARAAYEAGSGARAWAYLDRYVTLAGGPDGRAVALTLCLTEAVDPASEAGQAVPF